MNTVSVNEGQLSRGYRILSRAGYTILTVSGILTFLAVVEGPGGILYRHDISVSGPVFDACESAYGFFLENIEEERAMRETVRFRFEDLINQE